MNPYHDPDADERTHAKAVADAIDSLKRWVRIFVGVFIIFTFVVGSDSNSTHDALCKLRNNASARVNDSQKLLSKFSDEELLARFKISRKDAEANLARDRKAVDALSGLDCGGWWFL